MLLLCISIYLKPFLGYRFLIFDTYHPDTLIYVKKDVRVWGYFLKPKVVREQKRLAITAVWRLFHTNHRAVDGYFVHYTTRFICVDYFSSNGVNVASFELCGKEKEVTSGGAEEYCKRPWNVRIPGPKFEPVNTNIRSRSCND
jgi:hypothetical protein